MKIPRILVVLATLTPFFSKAEQIVFSEVMYHPPVGGYEFVEVQNLTATPFDIAEWKLRSGVDYDFPVFGTGSPTDSFLKAFERIVICETDPATFRAAYGLPSAVRVFGPWIGSLANSGERVTLKDKNGVTRCSMRYDDRHPWPASADGAGHSLVLADSSRAIDDYRVWRASSSASPTPGSGEPASAEEAYPNPEVNLSSGIPFVEYGDKWDFNDQNVDLGTTWKDTNYNFSHSGWTMENDAGNDGGLYGFETASLPSPGLQTALLNSDNAANHIAYYFRKEFTYTGSTSGATVTIDMINDDGAYFYLNGVPIGGEGVDANDGWKQTAGRTVTDATEELGVATNNGSALVVGTNIIAAQVHQTSNSSSDCVFGARLSIAAPSSPSVVINEVLPSASGFVEFFNPTGASIDIGGWYLSDDPGNLTKHQIPGSLVVPSSGLVSVGFTSSGLAVSSNTAVYLTQADGTSVSNAISTAMPLDGRSLGRKADGSGSWFLFTQPTQDASNSSASSDFSLKLNEFHVNGVDAIDWVEVYNPATASVSTSGLFVASLLDFSDKVALGATIPAGGNFSWATSFADAGGDRTLYLIDSANNVLDAIAVEEMAPRDHYAAYPDGSGEFFASVVGSQNAPNNPTREVEVVITELMVDPPSGHRDGEFIELYNKGSGTVDLSGWGFDRGVDFTFPAGTSLGAGSYLVIAANSALTSSAHAGANVVGQYEGQLANGGELLSLRDSWGNLADSVHYHTGGTWPQLAGGLGSSLELRHPEMDNAEGTAWADSDESNKSTFESYTLTEQYQQLTTRGGTSDYKELHLQCVGDSRLALKNMSLIRNGSGSNILPGGGNVVVTNGNAATGWLCQGTHYASEMSGGEFHVISDGHGDVKANRCEIDVTDISDNDNLTFSFEARWISGKPTFLVETWDRSFGGIFYLPIPNNLGTPGAANSAAISNAAPVVSGLIHSPAVPRSSDPVLVMAKVTGATSVNLRHRLDNSSGSGSWNSSPMNDGGTGGDEIANDGVFSINLTQYQSDNTIVQFYVEASSALEKKGVRVARTTRILGIFIGEVIRSATKLGEIRWRSLIKTELHYFTRSKETQSHPLLIRCLFPSIHAKHCLENMTFSDLKLPQPLLDAIEETGYREPTPIQARAIPVIMRRKDVIGIAQTGTGKTAAFTLPMLCILGNIKPKAPGIRALIISPTRELVTQIRDNIQDYSRHMSIQLAAVYGGVGEQPQIEALRHADIVIATPGRLIDLMDQGHLDMRGLEILVMDEADRMLDMGFLPAMRKLAKKMPNDRQTLLFSATLSGQIEKLTREFQKKPTLVEVGDRTDPAKTVRQCVYQIPRHLKFPLLLHLFESPELFTVLVFVKMKHSASRLAKQLSQSGVPAEAIHGDRTQNQRQRALDKFKEGKLRVLVGTDVAARGIDITGVTHVVNFDFPLQNEDYIHRIGRTGRAKAQGDAITFVTEHEHRSLNELERFIKRDIPRKHDRTFDYDVPAPVRDGAPRLKRNNDKAKPQSNRSPKRGSSGGKSSRGGNGGGRRGR